MLKLPGTQLLLCPLINFPVVGSSQPVPTRAASGFVLACCKYACTPLAQSRPTIQVSEGTRPLKRLVVPRSWFVWATISGTNEPGFTIGPVEFPASAERTSSRISSPAAQEAPASSQFFPRAGVFLIKTRSPGKQVKHFRRETHIQKIAHVKA